LYNNLLQTGSFQNDPFFCYPHISAFGLIFAIIILPEESLFVKLSMYLNQQVFLKLTNPGKLMNNLFFLPGTVFTLGTNELIAVFAGALLTGFLLKSFFDKVWPRTKKDNTDQMELELETLQSKFSSEIIKKEEEAKSFQDEMKQSEKKNFDLQLQYAKALNHIENMRSGLQNDEWDSENNSNVTANQVLLNLHNKISQQEENLLHLEQRLAQTEQQRLDTDVLYQQELTAFSDYKKLIEEQQKEEELIVAKLQKQLREKEVRGIRSEDKIKPFDENTTEEYLKKEILQLQNKLNSQSEEYTAAATISQKEEIAIIRTKAEEVSASIEGFRDHLTGIFRDAYSYEQLLSSNERLNQTINQVQQEKQMAEELLIAFQQQHQTVLTAEAEQKEFIETLRQQIAEKSNAMGELQQIRDELQVSVNELTMKLSEKERISREMIHAMKDIEHRFGGSHENYEDGAAVMENADMHYR